MLLCVSNAVTVTLNGVPAVWVEMLLNGLLNESCRWIVIVVEMPPARIVTGDEMNTRWSVAAAVMVSISVPLVIANGSVEAAVSVTFPALVFLQRKLKLATPGAMLK